MAREKGSVSTFVAVVNVIAVALFGVVAWRYQALTKETNEILTSDKRPVISISYPQMNPPQKSTRPLELIELDLVNIGEHPAIEVSGVKLYWIINKKVKKSRFYFQPDVGRIDPNKARTIHWELEIEKDIGKKMLENVIMQESRIYYYLVVEYKNYYFPEERPYEDEHCIYYCKKNIGKNEANEPIGEDIIAYATIKEMNEIKKVIEELEENNNTSIQEIGKIPLYSPGLIDGGNVQRETNP